MYCHVLFIAVFSVLVHGAEFINMGLDQIKLEKKVSSEPVDHIAIHKAAIT